jgi:hypothetical protein
MILQEKERKQVLEDEYKRKEEELLKKIKK